MRGPSPLQWAPLLRGSGDGKQSPPNPEGKCARWSEGPQDHGHTLTHRLGSLGPPTEGSWNSNW